MADADTARGRGAAVSWKDMARRLAARLEHHAYCETHPPHRAEPEHCPFCHDRAVYREWQQMAGTA